jgi:CBS-domain-containing membrane protein
MVEELKDMGANKVVFFCVEESPYACHRSIVAEKLHKLFGYPVNHL